MGYKLKFEDFLDKMQGLLDNAKKQGHVIVRVEDLENAFPELAESEDEKIKKRITLCLEECVHSDVIRDYEKDECIAWLEKQECLDEIVSRCKNSWYNEGKIDGMAEGLTDDEKYQQGWHDALEKLGEKHPDPYNGISFEYNGHIWGMCARDNGVDISCDKHLIKHLEKQGEQKIEENKGNIEGISSNWSEEDEAFLDDILCKLEHDLILNKDEKDWLKSLRPQNRWKPNEGDIIILEKVIRGELEPKVFQATLQGILEQLKKLKDG